MPSSKLNDSRVRAILIARHTRKPRPTYAQLAREFGVSLSTIQNVCLRSVWQHVAVPELNLVAVRSTREEG